MAKKSTKSARAGDTRRDGLVDMGTTSTHLTVVRAQMRHACERARSRAYDGVEFVKRGIIGHWDTARARRGPDDDVR